MKNATPPGAFIRNNTVEIIFWLLVQSWFSHRFATYSLESDHGSASDQFSVSKLLGSSAKIKQVHATLLQDFLFYITLLSNNQFHTKYLSGDDQQN